MRAARPEMTDEELATFAHRNVVTRSLGSKDDIEPDVYVGLLHPGDLYLLCTDGLWGVVPDEKIASDPPDDRTSTPPASRLVDAANEAGGPDNVTALLVRAGCCTRVRRARHRSGMIRGSSTTRGARLPRARAGWVRPRPRPPSGRWRRGAGGGRWSAPSILRHGWPMRWGPAGSGPTPAGPARGAPRAGDRRRGRRSAGRRPHRHRADVRDAW